MKHWVKSELNLLALAVSFFTRLPVPANLDYSQANLNRASRYFTLAGWLVGGLVASAYGLASLWFPVSVSLVLSILVSVLITGAFHEDGLADTADGLGGGWTTEQKLRIMKDSRLGTYGAVALWCALSLKLALLLAIADRDSGGLLVVSLIIAHPLSRAVSTCLIFCLPYVSEASTAKVKPLAENQEPADLVVSLGIACVALFFVPEATSLLALLLFFTGWGCRTFLRRQIGGFTGDTLGATQQVSELVIYGVILGVCGGMI